MTDGLRSDSYDERLRILQLNSLEERRNRADLIQMFKIFKRLSVLPFKSMFALVKQKITRGHGPRIQGSHAKIKFIGSPTFLFRQGKEPHTQTDRVIDRWNGLSDDVVSAGSVNSFKSRLQQFCYKKMGFLKD